MHDPAEEQLLAHLRQLQNGIAPDGVGDNGKGHVSMSTRLEAGRRIAAILERREAESRRRQEVDRTHDLTADQQRHAQEMDQGKLLLEAELERRRLDQEQEKIEIQKAEVVIRALEVAARNPEITQLRDVVGELSYRLLGGEMLPVLEDKNTKEES